MSVENRLKTIGAEVNAAAVRRLDAAISSGRVFHACIVSGSTEDAREKVAAALSAAAVCLSESDRPCGRCSGCRKAGMNEHPDIYHVRVPSDRKSIPVDAIRDLKQIMNIRPNEAPRRAILIHTAELLGLPGQNALLAMLEEPASDVLFILITENERSLLETVRSRCAAVRLGAEAERQTDGAAAECGAAIFAAFTALAEARGAAAFAAARCTLLEETNKLAKLKTAELPDALERFRSLAAEELSKEERSGGDHTALYDAAERLALRCIEYAQANVSAGHVSGLLLSELCGLVK